MTREGFEEQQELRRARLLKRAELAEKAANAAAATARGIAGHIPFGQPILVGHHSERRHRRDLERIENGHRRSFEKREEAEDLRRRANAVGTGGISSDDPKAQERLEEKLQTLKAKQERQKRVNAAWRRHGKPPPDNADGWGKVAADLGIEPSAAGELRLQYAQLLKLSGFREQPPFPGYAVANLSAEVRRLELRIEELRSAEGTPWREESHGTFTVVEDPSANRVRITFPAIPADEVRALLKRHGFRWSPTAGAWQRHLNNAGRNALQMVLSRLKELGGAT